MCDAWYVMAARQCVSVGRSLLYRRRQEAVGFEACGGRPWRKPLAFYEIMCKLQGMLYRRGREKIKIKRE